MPRELVVLDGSTFFASDNAGDVYSGRTSGFFYCDARHLSHWRLLVDGAPVQPLTTRVLEYYAARIVGTVPSTQVGENTSLSIVRDRVVADGVHEEIAIENHSAQPHRVELLLEFAADFADIFEFKAGLRAPGRTSIEVEDGTVLLCRDRKRVRRGTRLRLSVRPQGLDQRSASFSVELAPRARWSVCIDVSCIARGSEHGSRVGHGGQFQPQMPLTLEQWIGDAPRLEADWDPLTHIYRRSLQDLASLRFRPSEDLEWSLPAAGAPWFMALFGRDSLIAAYQTLPFQPKLAATTLEALASLQAKERDDFTDAEPGKILHELRRGPLTESGVSPHRPYYGTHDATPLFLVLLDEYERWTGDGELVRALEPAARAALSWLDGPGDPDGDGYLEYQTRSPRGLANQCWKDSANSMLFADGGLAQPPIATCELQGYLYDARIRGARLARLCWRDDALAEHLERQARTLQEKFDRDFWSDERGCYVLALDGRKRQVDSATSNIGHLLWSRIVPESRAAQVAERLMRSDLFSGWGIRTMSSGDGGYNPLEYHNGTVWPHDTAIVAEGLRAYGFRPQASRLACTLLEAAEAFDSCLPEVFAGFAREATRVPVEYATASRPQAWAAGAPLLALRTLLGLDVVDCKLRADPWLHLPIGSLRLDAVPVCGARYDVGG